MDSNLAHFAINADDMGRARRFYEGVFGWQFEAWGPPGFFQINTGEGGLRGALQQRRELKAGVPTNGFECTVGVQDIDAVAKNVAGLGGKVLMPKAAIAGVGYLMFFEDSEGNVVGAMQYSTDAQ